MKRADGAHMIRDEMESVIRQQEQIIRRLSVDNDNLHERIRKLEAALEAESEHVILRTKSRCDDDDLDRYAESLPV